MGKREDIKLGLTRVSQLFLGDENGQLGEEVTDILLDLGTGLTVTAAQINDAVLNPPESGPFSINEGWLADTRLGLVLYDTKKIVRIALVQPPPNCYAEISAAELINAVFCPTILQDLLLYSIAVVGDPLPPGDPDPTAVKLILDCTYPDGPLPVEVQVEAAAECVRGNVLVVLETGADCATGDPLCDCGAP
jgi:hypothetical protein